MAFNIISLCARPYDNNIMDASPLDSLAL